MAASISPHDLTLTTGALAGFIKPCQPTLSDKAPTGPLWLHEIKHDGYRIIACKRGDEVRLWSRNGRDWSRGVPGRHGGPRGSQGEEIALDGEAMGWAAGLARAAVGGGRSGGLSVRLRPPGIVIPHDCCTGQCSTCPVRIYDGEVDDGGTREGDTVLACQATISGNAVIEFDEVPLPGKRSGTVTTMRRISPDIFEIVVTLSKPLTHLLDELVFHIRACSEGVAMPTGCYSVMSRIEPAQQLGLAALPRSPKPCDACE